MHTSCRIPKQPDARGAPLLLACMILAGTVWAQYSMPQQLNTELYGRGMGSPRYSNVPFYQSSLPSEDRNAAFLSGALRSELRGQYLSTGPLAPSGTVAYIPSSARPYGGLSSGYAPRINTSAPLYSSPSAFRTSSPATLPGAWSSGPPMGSFRNASMSSKSSFGYRTSFSSTYQSSNIGSARFGR